MNLRRACEHGRWDPHELDRWWPVGGGPPERDGCPGGTEPTTDELLATVLERLKEEGLTNKEIGYRIGQAVGRHLSWEVTP